MSRLRTAKEAWQGGLPAGGDPTVAWQSSGCSGDLGSLCAGGWGEREGGKGRRGRGPLPFGLFFVASFLFIELCH